MRAARAQLATGAAGPLLFIAIAIIEGATRSGYDPMVHPVSALALGDNGWMQTANFFLLGSTTLLGGFGLRAALRPLGGGWAAPTGLILFGLGHIGAALFPCDPVFGYPDGGPDHPPISDTNAMHQLTSFIAFGGLILAAIALAIRFNKTHQRAWCVYTVLSLIAFGTVMGVSGQALTGDIAALEDFGGLLQRIGATIGWVWIAMVTLRLRKFLTTTPPALPADLAARASA